jgi:DNA mismatch repair protein MutS
VSVGHGDTPMLRQYREIKQRYPDHVLFYRMGDFYEMFYDDARIAHEVLGLVMTSRGQQGGEDVPLAGFPYHAVEPNLAKMVRAGYRVAVCEQVEDPKKAKGLVRRDVVEVVTAGTRFTSDVMESGGNNFLAALKKTKAGFALAWSDVTTGEFAAGEYTEPVLRELIASLEVAEVLVMRGQSKELAPLVGKAVSTRMEDWFFSPDSARRDLCEHFNVNSLKGFGLEDEPEAVACAGALLHYARENLKSGLEHISGLRRHDPDGRLLIDPSTRRNLELTRSMSSEQGPTLLKTLDRCVTPMGRRQLRFWLTDIPSEAGLIRSRHDALDELLGYRQLDGLTGLLKGIGDLERIVARLAADRANGRDLKTLSAALAVIPDLMARLGEISAEEGLIYKQLSLLDPLPELSSRIERWIVDQPPLAINQGGVIRNGVSQELDDLREIMTGGKDWIRRFEEQERSSTGISNLKIKYNKVFGYHIEISKANLSRVPEHYNRRQTLVNAERYITPELKEYEDKVLGAEEKIAQLEQQLFQEVTARARPHYRAIQLNARAIAELDVLIAFALVSRQWNYCRPRISTKGEFFLKQARHPVIEQVLPAGERFVPNDVHLQSDREQVLLLTGPNMAGKSTYLRMTGLITLLAHMGCHVPAESATIPLRDRIFTRVGASDNLAGGESTFLVEMNEAAFILNHATDKSLVLLDEIGRGTSTFDGLSLAWSITEYLHDAPGRRALTLFATHYHELVALEQSLVRLRNANIEVRQYGERILFTRRILPGGCSHSYGIDVARMAGLPTLVIQRAREVLAQLEAHEYSADLTPSLQQKPGQVAEPKDQLSLFFAPDQDMRRRIREANVESMTPLEAMKLLISLKQMLGD